LWQSVPYIFDEKGNYCINSLPVGYKLDTFSLEIEDRFRGRFAEVSLVNGFCMAIRRSLLNDVGYFNGQDFPVGYGEETDFCIRTCKLGYLLCSSCQ
jgi:GT2 family glycosyltransferase